MIIIKTAQHTHTHVTYCIMRDQICQSSYCKAKFIQLDRHTYLLRWCRGRIGE